MTDIKIVMKNEKLIQHCKLCICIEECQIFPIGHFTSDDPIELQKVRIDFLKNGEFFKEYAISI